MVQVTIPKEIDEIGGILKDAGFDAYAVGGCVRDLLREHTPADWDIATNADPKEIQHLFPHSFYENKFGTVTIVTESKKDSLKHVEVTSYRADVFYSDKRHPDEVAFVRTIEEDLKRRDFTVNAIAVDLEAGEKMRVIDLFGGKKDLEDKLIRAVGNAEERFKEDALRLLRAARLATQLDFDIEPATASAIMNHAGVVRVFGGRRGRGGAS